MDILRITASILKNDSIDEYAPITGINPNYSGGDIRIDIETHDVIRHPCESYLFIKGRLSNADETAYAKF